MKPADDRCEEHGLYLYRRGMFGWSCKLGCYYCDDPLQIREGHIQEYKEELKDKIKNLLELYKFKYTYELDDGDEETVVAFDLKLEEEILEMLK